MRYGLIGNCKTCALIHETGAIDWCCLPNFDSPSAFARLLDPAGGTFQITLAGSCQLRQSYLPSTNILQTEFDDGENAFVLIDFMPRYREGEAHCRPVEIHRLLRPLRGHPVVRITYQPRLNYARGETVVKVREGVIVAMNALEDIFLYSDLPLEGILADQPVPLTMDHYCILTYHEKLSMPTIGYALDMLDKTKTYWDAWANYCRLPAFGQDAALRSALTLKLMTFEDTGAIIAAPTTSLPEALNEGRNWDYRFCWLRDASLLLEALKRIGHFGEAKAFIHFLLRLFESKQTKTQIVYSIDARSNLEEEILPHLKGYRDSGPVRIGNNAWHTKQNDIFGEILHTLYLFYVTYQFEPMNDEVWALVRFLVNTIAREWATEDAGIWELRRQTAHFTFSKVLSWVALDRGIKIAEKLGKTYAAESWRPIAAAIHQDIEAKGWNADVGAFTQAYGSSHFDASLLLLERYGFLKRHDPRWIATVRLSETALACNGFTFRYTNPDDFGRPKNAFIVASFWLAKALASIGEDARARTIFERVVAHANPVGLLSEGVDPVTGELFGNFPQAYSHMALINTAMVLGAEKG
ncbi:MAG: glycoside hydrolase family 15 protein [Deltaproteobacteria bacterium]|nr:glycoside hydrolase family 15 protein [Deltaproteobacteria bacterium]